MHHQGNIRIAFLFTILGVIATLFIIPYQIQLVGAAGLEQVQVPLPILYAIMSLQMGALVFIFSFLGLRMAERVGLSVSLLREWLYDKRMPSFSKSVVWISLLGGAIGALLLMLIDLYIFLPLIPEIATLQASPWWVGLLTLLYGGIVEEVSVRLFLMTLVVWLLVRLTRKAEGNIPASFYWTGMVVATLIFGALHLPATAQAFGELTPLLVSRGLVMNGLLGIFFGYLYWKKGLEYAIIAHASADLFLHSILPQFIHA